MITDLICRTFLGWDTPFLPQLARQLVARHDQGRAVDMAQVLVVLPGGNAVRRLLELLTREAERVEKILFQPKIFTSGSLFEQVFPSFGTLASEGARILAWMDALKAIPGERLQILAAVVPDKDDFRAWLALAERVDSLHREISGAGLTFAEVALRGSELATFLDEERWQVLDEVAQTFAAGLERQMLVDDYSNRILRLKNIEPIALAGPLYLAGIAELNQNQRDLLASINSPVESFVFAPQDEEMSFDEFGCVRPDVWSERPVDLKQELITIVESPRDVIGKFVQKVTQLSSRHSLSDISIGLGDESEISYFKGSLMAAGVAVRAASGSRFSVTALGAYLRGIHQYLSSKTFIHFAAIAKHPYQQAVLLSLLPQKISIAASLDRYQEQHFQATISHIMPVENASDRDFFGLVSAFHGFLGALLGPPRVLPAWIAELRGLLDKLLPVLSADDLVLVGALGDLLSELAEADKVMEVRGSEALLLFLHLADAELNLPDADAEAIELLGWLELALDDAPALLISSLDESIVPAVINADPFLPNTLRRHLGLTDNARRLGRDLFLFASMIHSKVDLSIVLARRKLDGSPRFPSRLLLSCPVMELPQRIAYLYQEGRRYQLGTLVPHSPRGQQWRLTEPQGFAGVVQSMSVTSFKDYLVCPYRFFLRHVQKTREHPGNLFELDALNFGTLCHLVLDRFARDPGATSVEGDIIYEVLNRILTTITGERFGKHEYPAIRVQIEQLRERFRALSYWQADQNREGWKILAVEYAINPNECVIKHAQGVMGLRGRIDRVDFHPSSNQYRIIDYKTADAGQNLKYVFKKNRWLDLQMPLYFHAMREVYPEADLTFFYCNISAHSAREQLIQVGQSQSEIEAGIEQARSIAESVATGIFWPPTSRPQKDNFDWVIGSLEIDDAVSAEDESDD